MPQTLTLPTWSDRLV